MMILLKMKNIYLLMLVVTVTLFFPILAHSWESETLIETGDPANRVNVVIMGEGYTESELIDFRWQVRSLVRYLLREEPFNEYQNYFNFYRIDVISNESGIDRPHREEFVDTALDGWESLTGPCTIWVHRDKVALAAEDIPAPAIADDIFVLINDSSAGACATNKYLLVPGGFSHNRTALHEFGHEFAYLYDEYEFGEGINGREEPWYPNVTIQTERDKIKWNHWIDPETLLPTPESPWPEPMTDIPGIYQGTALGADTYRSTERSIMRDSRSSFHSVHKEVIVLTIYNRVSQIETFSPAEGEITLAVGEERVFEVTTVKPMNHDLLVDWFLNDQLIAEGNTFTLTSTNNAFTSGINDLRVVASDPTPLVRKEDDRIYDTRDWQILLEGDLGPALNLIEDQNVHSGELLEFSVSATSDNPATMTVSPEISDLTSLGATFIDHGNNTGTFSWTPSFDQSGMDHSFTFSATDEFGLYDSQKMKITVDRAIEVYVSDSVVEKNGEFWVEFGITTSLNQFAISNVIIGIAYDTTAMEVTEEYDVQGTMLEGVAGIFVIPNHANGFASVVGSTLIGDSGPVIRFKFKAMDQTGTYPLMLAAGILEDSIEGELLLQPKDGSVTITDIVPTLFLRGDANNSGKVDLSDVVFTLNLLYGKNDTNPVCMDALDANDDGRIDISDGVTMLLYLFGDGAILPAPFPDPGIDPTEDALGCL